MGGVGKEVNEYWMDRYFFTVEANLPVKVLHGSFSFSLYLECFCLVVHKEVDGGCVLLPVCPGHPG